MDREEIIQKVKNITNIDNDEVTTLCQDNIDDIQDNEICTNIYNHDFSFLTDYGEINTTPSYTTGTVSVTQDSTTVTGSETSWTSSMVGRYIKIADDDEYYEISSVDSSTQITLTSAYIGSTASGQSYTIYKIFYPLASDFKKMKWIKQIVTPKRLIEIPEITMAELITDEFDESGEIVGYALSGQDSSGNTLIRFTPIQTTRKRVYYCYEKTLPSINSTGAESLIPSKWHMLFVYKLAEIVFRANDLEGKANDMAMQFERKLQAFIREDKSKTKDRIDIMADECVVPRLNRVHLPYDHFPKVL